VIHLPIGVINGMSRELRGTEITAKTAAGINLTMLGNNPSTLGGKERSRRLLRIDIGREFSGSADLMLDASAGAFRDTVSRTINVQPLGFPHESSTGGVLDANGS
jgi:hypothetical protein